MSNSVIQSLSLKNQAVDWVLWASLVIISSVITFVVKPHCRPFMWNDPSISYPMQENTFPDYSLLLMVFCSLIFCALWVLFLVPTLRRLQGGMPPNPDESAPPMGRSTENHCGPLYPWIRAQLWAFALQLFVVNVSKVYAGRLRPDYIARLASVGYKESVPSLPSPMSDAQFYCKLMVKHPILWEGRLSFPSGHSGTAFSVFTITSLLLFAHLRPWAGQGSFARLFTSLSPMTIAFMCAISRTRDNKHNFSDITAGSLIGFGSALLAFAGSFRLAGGASTIVLARQAHDIEQLQEAQYVMYHQDLYGNLDSVPRYQSVHTTAGQTGARRGGDDERCTAADETTTALSIRPQVPLAFVTERELNEAPAAVRWI